MHFCQLPPVKGTNHNSTQTSGLLHNLVSIHNTVPLQHFFFLDNQIQFTSTIVSLHRPPSASQAKPCVDLRETLNRNRSPQQAPSPRQAPPSASGRERSRFPRDVITGQEIVPRCGLLRDHRGSRLYCLSIKQLINKSNATIYISVSISMYP